MWKIRSTKRLARRGYSLEELLKGTQLFVLNMKIDTTRPSYFQTMVSQLASNFAPTSKCATLGAELIRRGESLNEKAKTIR